MLCVFIESYAVSMGKGTGQKVNSYWFTVARAVICFMGSF